MKTTAQADDLTSSRITPADGNVFADLGFSAKEAEALLADADARMSTRAGHALPPMERAMVMPETKSLSADEIERLVETLDEGAYDDLLVPPGDKAALTLKFSELTPFDVQAWAERRGIKLPTR